VTALTKAVLPLTLLLALGLGGCLLPDDLRVIDSAGDDDDSNTTDDDDSEPDDDDTADDDDSADDDDTADDDDSAPDDDDSVDDDDTADDDDDTADDDDTTPDDDDSADDDDTAPDDDDTADDDDTTADDDDTAPDDDDATSAFPTASITAPTVGATLRDSVLLEAQVGDSDDDVELITVTWTSSLDGLLGQTAPGSDGSSSFEATYLSSGTHVLTVTAEDPSGNNAQDTVAVTVDVAPSAPTVSLSPASPITTDTLFANIDVDSVDPEGETVLYTYEWRRDGILQPALTSVFVSASATTAGETWLVEVFSADSFGVGGSGVGEVDVLNSPPSTPTVTLLPTSPRAGIDDLFCEVTVESDDEDGDSVAYSASWEVGSVPWAGLTATTTWPDDTLPAAETQAGEDWTCAIAVTDGADTTTSSTAPVTVADSLGVREVMADYHRICTVDLNDQAECWGRDTQGELSQLPDESFATLDVDSSHSCGVTTGGELRCWGQDAPDLLDQIPAGTGYSDVTVGSTYACAIDGSLDLSCWGYETDDVLADTPSFGGWAEVHSGDHFVCALSAAGDVLCWGRDDYSQVTDTPTATGFTSLAVGQDNVCGVNASGELQCWGRNINNIITTAPSGTGWVSVHTGKFARHYCAIDLAGALTCWGPTGGVHGNWQVVNEAPAGAYTDVTMWEGAAAAAVRSDGALVTWADWTAVPYMAHAHNYGSAYSELAVGGPEFGNGSDQFACMTWAAGGIDCLGDDELTVVTDAPPTGTWTGLTAGDDFACGIEAGLVTCWGDDLSGQVTNAPIEATFIQVDAGVDHACAVDENDDIACWGDNTDSQLSGKPAGLEWQSVSAGGAATCGLTTTGTIRCWGNNSHGQTTGPDGLTGYDQVSMGERTSCALTTGGTIDCWGTTSPTPPATAGWEDVRTTFQGGCARGTVGEVVCWGAEEDLDEEYPAAAGFTDMDAAHSIGCALDADGHLGCWGGVWFDLHW
jgi:alpha-tubulin suppressor-like RCC1 family protein